MRARVNAAETDRAHRTRHLSFVVDLWTMSHAECIVTVFWDCSSFGVSRSSIVTVLGLVLGLVLAES